MLIVSQFRNYRVKRILFRYLQWIWNTCGQYVRRGTVPLLRNTTCQGRVIVFSTYCSLLRSLSFLVSRLLHACRQHTNVQFSSQCSITAHFSLLQHIYSHFVSAKSDDLINSCFLKVAAETLGIRLTSSDIDRVSVR